MKRYLLDTNICIYIIKNKPQSVKEKFKEFDIGTLTISSITVSELYYGAYKSQFVEKNLLALEHFLKPFDIIDFDTKSAIEYGKIRADLERKGLVIGGLDMQIASIAKINNMILITNNIKEFERVANLEIENWI